MHQFQKINQYSLGILNSVLGKHSAFFCLRDLVSCWVLIALFATTRKRSALTMEKHPWSISDMQGMSPAKMECIFVAYSRLLSRQDGCLAHNSATDALMLIHFFTVKEDIETNGSVQFTLPTNVLPFMGYTALPAT